MILGPARVIATKDDKACAMDIRRTITRLNELLQEAQQLKLHVRIHVTTVDGEWHYVSPDHQLEVRAISRTVTEEL